MTEPAIRTWHIRLLNGTSWPFFATTRRDYSVDDMYRMMPRKGIGGLLVPVLGQVPAAVNAMTTQVRDRYFVSINESDVIDMWYIDDLPPAQQLRLYDTIHASTDEST